ncbi:MAG: hypothetical protein ACOCRB_01485 [Halanaerobiaceae bacterium]
MRSDRNGSCRECGIKPVFSYRSPEGQSG